jgi:hypothetical protein
MPLVAAVAGPNSTTPRMSAPMKLSRKSVTIAGTNEKYAS